MLMMFLVGCVPFQRKFDAHYIEPVAEKTFPKCGTAEMPCFPVKGTKDEVMWYEENGEVICTSERFCWILTDKISDPSRLKYLMSVYRAPYYDRRERRIFRHRVASDLLDVVSTRRGLKHGCVEGNFLLGKSPSTPKTVVFKMVFWVPMRWDMHNSPMRWSSADAWQYKAHIGLAYAAAGWNTHLVNAGKCGG
jgi:hypothetical protein